MHKKWIPLTEVSYDDLYRVVDDIFTIQSMKILEKEPHSVRVEIESLWDDDIVAYDIVDLSCILSPDEAVDTHSIIIAGEGFRLWQQFLMAKGHHRSYMLLEGNPYVE